MSDYNLNNSVNSKGFYKIERNVSDFFSQIKANRTDSKYWIANSAERYENIIQVGEGTYGKVFKARDKSGEKKFVALKCILMDKEREGFPVTALREIMLLKNLKHVNIINLLEIVSTKQSKDKISNVYLVFEYMDHDLAGLIRSKVNFRPETIKSIFYQVLLGLHYLHKNNIIHRDIKSANILVNKEGDIKVGDFGLARKVNPDIPQDKNKFTNKVVTLWYRAPEILLGARNYTYVSDVWSAGCMFLEILFGEPVFKGQDEKTQVQAIFEKCGSPIDRVDNEDFNSTDKIKKNYWPDVTKYDLYNHYRTNKQYPSVLEKIYKDCCKTDSCFDLIGKMLTLNPDYRTSSEELLKHPFFSEEPSMSKEQFYQFLNESHEFHVRKAQTNQLQIKDEQVAEKSYDNSSLFLGNKRDKD